MENLELDQLVYSYPDSTQEQFQTLVSAREEFREVSGRIKEPAPRKGELFRHQKFIQRFMRQYDSQFIIHQVGTGKGCAVISVAQHYRAVLNSLESIRNDNSLHAPYKRAYVLVKGQTLIDEFKYQILCKCTDGDYITPQIVNSKTETARKSNITRSIGKFYEITTYGTLAKRILEMTDQQLHDTFDNTIIIVDEVHNINPERTGGDEKIHPISGVPYYTKKKKNKKTGDFEDKIIENRLIYDQLWRLFHTAKPRKAIIMSATPMINSADEIGPRINLLLPENNQIPDILNWHNVSLEDLEPYFRGLISYVRALDTGAITQYQGDVIDATYYLDEVEEIVESEDEDEDEELDILDPTAKKRDLEQLKALQRSTDKEGEGTPSQLVVYATQMSEKQNKVYELAQTNPEKLRPDSKNPGAFNDLERQTANFVFPDNSSGSSGFRKYVAKSGNRYQATQELYDWISDPEKLQQLSTKFASIVEMCKTDPGNCWCYSNFIKGGGAIVLGLCFQAQGFEEFSDTSSVFSLTGASGLAPVCSGKTLEDVEGERFVRIDKRLRYALLTSDTTGPEASSLLELFNSYENRHGEYIKAVIGSPVTRDGLNLANVLQIHLIGPGWNQASSYQAESRAIRSTSHVDLIEERREELRLQNASQEEIDAANVIIRVFRHAAISDSGTSIDLQMYQLSEIKDREIKRITRMMKQCAVDCQINYTRNVRPGDIDYSANCDYDICEYKCVDPEPDYVDYTSYDVLYSGDVIAAAQQEIIDIFRVVFSLPYLDLYKELSSFRKKFVDLAVKELVETKTPITDRYGARAYLREDRGTLYLSPDFPLSLTSRIGESSIADYTGTILGISEMSLQQYNSLLQKEEGLTTTLDPDSEEFVKYLEELSLENKVEILEQALTDYYVADKKDDRTVQIINTFVGNVFLLYEPKKALALSNKFLSKRGKGKGRKPAPGTKFTFNPIQEEEVMETFERAEKADPVYFHNLYSTEFTGTAYQLTAKSRKYTHRIRLMKPQERTGWRDATEVEEPVYNTYIKYKSEEAARERPDIYGTILEDGKFRIVDKTTEDVESATKDSRKVKRGRDCNTMKLYDLLRILWNLNYQAFEPNDEFNDKQITNFLIARKLATREEVKEFSREKLLFYQSWATTNKGQICEILRKYFENEGILY